jgi:hypothetical protein
MNSRGPLSVAPNSVIEESMARSGGGERVDEVCLWPVGGGGSGYHQQSPETWPLHVMAPNLLPPNSPEIPQPAA